MLWQLSQKWQIQNGVTTVYQRSYLSSRSKEILPSHWCHLQFRTQNAWSTYAILLHNVSVRDKGEALLDPEYAIDFLSNNSFRQDFCTVIFGPIVDKLWSLPTVNILQMGSALLWQEKKPWNASRDIFKNKLIQWKNTNLYSGKYFSPRDGEPYVNTFPFSIQPSQCLFHAGQNSQGDWFWGDLTALLEADWHVYNSTKLRTELKSRIW